MLITMLISMLTSMLISMLIQMPPNHLIRMLIMYVTRIRGGAIMTHHELPGHGMGVMIVTPTPDRCLLCFC
jgi:hypothetical protein